MADEIERNNVVAIERNALLGVWSASIGPRDRGVTAVGSTPVNAMIGLALKCERLGWIFDPTWILAKDGSNHG